ncbi:MAG: bifunctional 2-C-methyl-D-erythritol 4-phosphate cytidylyltransferase/2-C-methyl-D-erythritol 2,4-cyclodiphosphate synthase [Alphaproteobacteria bacterium]|nr:bifunctional 2-C-methyl-D-erythritol 4-phosphate cytidylyltransferase/2-C-methyl-D-erythritol 2,4-cyclodiphosphate synthase [Alphaproteobacteria bacterium]
MRVGAVLAAAGSGRRAGGEEPKQFRLLHGKPLYQWGLQALLARTDQVVIVADPAAFERFQPGPATLVAGGAERTDSIRAGLEALDRSQPPEVVLIHDAARPGLTPALIDRLLQALKTADAAAPALPAADALRLAENGKVTGEASRAGLWRVQTPQAFRFAPILAAFRALPPGAAADDDLAIARTAGLDVRLVPGDHRLMKATYPEDFEALERLMGTETRIGQGFDAHRFGDGDHVTLCGVRIAHARGLMGHSDADAGWHALTDAILGALALGDIGDHFPPSDPQWKGANSELFLAHAVKLVRDAGGRIVNADVTLICERPKISPHRETMRARTAQVLGVAIDRVSVKATTTERMGFTGREEGLAAQASVSVAV